MRWSSLIKGKNLNQNLNAAVMEYKPTEFNLGTPSTAIDYLKQKKQGSDFTLSDALKQTTRINEIEKAEMNKKIEEAVLDKVSEIQTQAYDEGFKIGQEDGFQTAYKKQENLILSGVEDIQKLLISIESMKPDLLKYNESHIMKLVFEIAKKIAFDHIQTHPESILNVIKQSIDAAQAEEHVKVFVAREQIEFIESFKNSEEKQFQYLKKVHVEASDEVKPGGCIIETNYGLIDATIEQRVQKLWQEFSDVIPVSKDKVEKAG